MDLRHEGKVFLIKGGGLCPVVWVGSLRMKALPVLVTLVWLGLPLAGCGGSSAGRGSGADVRGAAAATLPQIETKGDADMDSDRYGTEGDDENERFGHPASARDARAVASLVERYYAAAAHDDGAGGCRLLYASVAESVPEDYGRPPGPVSLRGNTCGVVLSKLFAQTRGRRAGGAPRVVSVRVDLNRGSAQFGFGRARPDRYVLVHRERGGWKMSMLLDIGRPVGVE